MQHTVFITCQQADISEGINVDGENVTNLTFADDAAFSTETTNKWKKIKRSELRKSERWPKNTPGKDKIH